MSGDHLDLDAPREMLGGGLDACTYNPHDNWLTQEFARASARLDALPDFARPVQTRPDARP